MANGGAFADLYREGIFLQLGGQHLLGFLHGVQPLEPFLDGHQATLLGICQQGCIEIIYIVSQEATDAIFSEMLP